MDIITYSKTVKLENTLTTAINAKYTKPNDGIPSTDMATAVVTSLRKADTAYQKPSGGIPKTDLASAVQTSLGLADTALQGNDVATAVDAWLDINFTNPDSPPLDRSLLSSSSAAPADIVGNIKNAIDLLEILVVGKNKWNKNTAAVGKYSSNSVDSDSNFKHIIIDVTPGDILVASYLSGAGATKSASIYSIGKYTGSTLTETESVTEDTYTVPAGVTRLGVAVRTGSYGENIQIEITSDGQRTTYEAYYEIAKLKDSVIIPPIEEAKNGFASLDDRLDSFDGKIEDLTDTSKNLFDKVFENARYGSDGFEEWTTGSDNAGAKPIDADANKTYTASWSGVSLSSGTWYFYVAYLNSSGERISETSSTIRSSGAEKVTFTTPSNTVAIGIYTYKSSADWEDIVPANFMLEEGSSESAYVPHEIFNSSKIDPDAVKEKVIKTGVVESIMLDKTSHNLCTEKTWQHKVFSNGVLVDDTHEHTISLDKSAVTGGKYLTVSWGNSVMNDGYFYIHEFAQDGSQISESPGRSWGYHQKTILLNSLTKSVGLHIYCSSCTDHEKLIPDYVIIEYGSYKTASVNHDVVDPENIDYKKAYEKMVESGMIKNAYATIPDYYLDGGYIDGKIGRINTLGLSLAASAETGIFITDEHWTGNQKVSPNLIGYIDKHCNIPNLISGGDVENYGGEEFAELLRRYFCGRIHHVAGNHEWFSPTTGSKIYYLYDMYNNDQIGDPVNHYYYFDNPQLKIRNIVLNSFTRSGSSVIDGYTNAELTWLENTALNVPSGWNVIVWTHWIGTTLNKSSGASSAITLFDNFNSADNGSKVLVIYQGHSHYDAVFRTPGGIPIITNTCDKNDPWIDEGVDREPWLTSDRISGTIYEQAFDVVFTDFGGNVAYLIRIGGLAMNNYAGDTETGFDSTAVAEERIVHLEPESVTTTKSLTPKITGTITWGSDDESIATVSGGTVTRVSSGTTFIYAINTDKQLEVWIVKAT